MARSQIGAVKAGAGDQHHAADTGRGRGAAGFGHALDREAGGFRLDARRSSSATDGVTGIEHIEIGEFMRQQRWIGEADILIVGRDPRHRHRALRELRHAVAADVVGRDHRLAASDQHAQADVVAFRPFGFLDAPVAHFDALRYAAHRDRVGCVGAGAFGGLHQPLRQRRERGLVEQAGV